MLVARHIIFIILGLAGLYLGSIWLVKGAARLATSFRVSALVVGMTVVAFGTSLPELIVNLSAALQGSTDLALGNVLGSNTANVGLVLGMTALLTPVAVRWRLLWVEVPIMISASLLVFVLALDGMLGRIEALLLVLGMAGFGWLTFWLARRDRREVEPELLEFEELGGMINSPNRLVEAGRVVIGLAALLAAAQALIDGSLGVARLIGVSEGVIGFTLMAFGTSLPELATAITAAVHRESDIVVGSVIGSNISNLLLVLGATALALPLEVPAYILRLEFPVMLAFTLVLVPFLLDRRLVRWEGIVLVAAYLGFNIYLLVR